MGPKDVQPRKSREEKGNRQKNLVNSITKGMVIAGERFAGGNKHVRRLQLPSNIPDAMIYEIKTSRSGLSSDPFLKMYPVLKKDLSVENFQEKFTRLIQLEEAENDLNLRSYDIDYATFQRKNDFLRLEVTSLAEGRPSLLPGDSALCRLVGNPNVVYEGVIHILELDGVLMKFHPEFMRRYANEQFNVSFKTSRTSIRREHYAVERAIENLDPVVLFPRTIQFQTPLDKATGMKWFNSQLNSRQRSAVTGILKAECRPAPYIIFGPPGTGKTVTVVETILQLWKRNNTTRILACAGSNSCADTICQKLKESGVIGTPDMRRIVAFSRAENVPENIKEFAVTCDEDDLNNWLNHRIIVSTCCNAGRLFYVNKAESGHFTHVIIDEAATVTEPEALISVLQAAESKNGVIALVGDPFQLGPVIQCTTAKRHGLGMPLMSRIFDMDPYKRRPSSYPAYGGYDPRCIVKLVDSYRCCQPLITVNNNLFYHKELKCHPKTDDTLLARLALSFPIVFIGVVGKDMQEPDNPSWMNPIEINEVAKWYLKLTGPGRLHRDNIGIITPYRKQAERIRSYVRSGFEQEICKVSTIEDFQGQERDVIILSLVRSQELNLRHDFKFNLGFLFNEKRFNVATSRAKKLLIVIGNPHVMIKDACWKAFIRYVQDNGGYTGVNLVLGEDPYEDDS